MDASRLAKWYEEGDFIRAANEGVLIVCDKGLLRGTQYLRFSLNDSYRNFIVVATTGRGKTSACVIPNILECYGSVVCLDIKGELFRKTSGHMNDRGYQVWKLDLRDPDQSLRMNLLLRVKDSVHDLKMLCSTLVSHTLGSKGDPFWPISAQNLLFVLASALVNYKDQRYITFQNLKRLVNYFGTPELDRFVAEHLPDDSPAFDDYRAIKKCGDTDMLLSVIATARACLDIFNDPVVNKITSTDDGFIDFEHFRREPCILYISVPRSKLRYYSVFLSLVSQYVFSTLAEMDVDELREEGDVIPGFIFMEEFGQLTVPDFDMYITTLRDNEISTLLVLQSLSQLNTRYGADAAETILYGGVDTKIFFGGLSAKTNNELSEIIGKKWVTDKEGKKTKEAVMTPQEIRMMGNDFIVLHGTKPAAKLSYKTCYDVPDLREKINKPPVRYEFNYSEEPPLLLDMTQFGSHRGAGFYES